MTSDNETELMSAESGVQNPAGEPDYMFNSVTRLAIVEDIVRDISNMVPVIVISGEKGEGKSSLCHVVAAAIPSDWITILFSNTVESFEDVVRQIAIRTGCGEVDVSRKAMNDTIDIIGAKLAELDRKVVIVLDGAEMIYLATLERIRRMLDQLNDDNVSMHVVLCGRPLLLENLNQLSIVEFKEVPEKRYVLEPLRVDEVGMYIDHLVSLPDSGVSGSFLPAAIQQIHAVTGGNIGAVRQCVTEICSSENRDAALAALVENAEATKGGHLKIKLLTDNYLEALKKIPRRTQMIGGGVCIALFVIFLVFSGGEEESGSLPELQKETVISSSEPSIKAVKGEDLSAEKQKQLSPSNEKNDEVISTPSSKETVTPPVTKDSEVIAESPSGPEKKSESAGQTQDIRQIEEQIPSEPQSDIADQKTSISSDATEQSEKLPAADTDSESAVIEDVVQNESEPEAPSSLVEKAETGAEQQTKIGVEPQVASNTETVVEETQAAAQIPEVTEESESLSAATGIREVEQNVVELEGEVTTPLNEISDIVEEQEAQGPTDTTGSSIVQQVEIPLLKSGIYKRVVIPEQGNGNSEPVDSESSIVISSLAESEKREIALIPKNTYKIIKEEEIEEIVQPEEENVETVQPEVQQTEISAPLPPDVLVQDSVSPLVLPQPQEQDVESRIEKPVLAQPILPVPSPQLPISGSGSIILENRMEAGYPWLTGRRDDRYTMQLMMLSSEDAEEKIKGILSQREYGRASDKFYIFRKNSNPPVYFVFYGEYKNMTEARTARNTIPVFLRNHRPYVLSVPSAMKKVKL